MMNGRLKILAVLPFLVVIASFITTKVVNFESVLTAKEKQVLEFVPGKIEVIERQALVVKNDLKSPIEIIKSTLSRDFPSKPLSVIAPRIARDEGEKIIEGIVSLIVIGGERKIAIVNGVVVKEGDSVGGMEIAKIEKDRILIKSNGTKWLHLEGIK